MTKQKTLFRVETKAAFYVAAETHADAIGVANAWRREIALACAEDAAEVTLVANHPRGAELEDLPIYEEGGGPISPLEAIEKTAWLRDQ